MATAITEEELEETETEKATLGLSAEELLEELPGVGPATADKLKRAGFVDLQKIAASSPHELAEVAEIGVETAKKVIEKARDMLEMGFEGADKILEKRKSIGRITTGSKKLDALLGGGVETMSITEAFGKFGSGKCVAADTPLLFFSGNDAHLKGIGELYEDYKTQETEMDGGLRTRPNGELQVLSLTNAGETARRRITGMYRERVSRIMELGTGGSKIRVTGNHPLLVLDQEGIKWKSTGYVKVGEYVASAPLTALGGRKAGQEAVGGLTEMEAMALARLARLGRFQGAEVGRLLASDDETIALFLRNYFENGVEYVLRTGDREFAHAYAYAIARLGVVPDVGECRGKFTVAVNGAGNRQRLASAIESGAGMDSEEPVPAEAYAKIADSLSKKLFGCGMVQPMAEDGMVELSRVRMQYAVFQKRLAELVAGSLQEGREELALAAVAGNGNGNAGSQAMERAHGSLAASRLLENRELLMEVKTMQLLCRGIKWEKVTFIREMRYSGYVYDIEVEGSHNFIGGPKPMVMHNSQLGFQLAVNAQLPKEMGGLGGAVLFIDTEGTFRPERITQLAPEGFEKDILKGIYVARAINSNHQMVLVDKSEEIIKEKNIKLMVIDSLTSHFRSDYVGRASLGERQQKLNMHVHALQRIADKFNIAIYITNQVMDNPAILFGDPTTPIGGHVLAHAATYRMYLRKGKEDKRIARLVDSPNLPEGECIFKVTQKGLCD